MDNTEAMITEIADVEVASLEREGSDEFAKKDILHHKTSQKWLVFSFVKR